MARVQVGDRTIAYDDPVPTTSDRPSWCSACTARPSAVAPGNPASRCSVRRGDIARLPSINPGTVRPSGPAVPVGRRARHQRSAVRRRRFELPRPLVYLGHSLGARWASGISRSVRTTSARSASSVRRPDSPSTRRPWRAGRPTVSSTRASGSMRSCRPKRTPPFDAPRHGRAGCHDPRRAPRRS